jgi:hypothetical protein
MADLPRRFILGTTRAIGASMLSAAAQGSDTSSERAAPPASNVPSITYGFLNRDEAAFIESAVSRLIPADAARRALVARV